MAPGAHAGGSSCTMAVCRSGLLSALPPGHPKRAGGGGALGREGRPDGPTRGSVLDDVRIPAAGGRGAVDADAITLRNIAIAAATGPAIAVRDSRNVTLDGKPVAGGAAR